MALHNQAHSAGHCDRQASTKKDRRAAHYLCITTARLVRTDIRFATGKRNFQPMPMSWSYRKRGSVHRNPTH